MSDAKKPGLAAVIGLVKAKKAEPDEDDDGSYSASVDELADVLGVKDRQAFSDAFRAAVMSCK